MANALSIKKHDSPFNRQIAKEHKLALKLYKQTCNSKKHNFWRKETSRLDEALNYNEKFWKTWQTIGKLKLKTSTTTPNGERWKITIPICIRNTSLITLTTSYQKL